MLNNLFINIKFACPWALALLIILVLLVFWYVKSSSSKIAFLSLSSLKNPGKLKSLKPLLYHILFVFRCFAIATLILALARPQEEYSQEYIEGKGIDIMLCNDISASMEALDFVPNRMEASKKIAEDFVRTRFGDRIGVVVFGTYALSLCPLTTDTSAVISQLNTINVGEYDADHSLISSGLATCINKLRNSKKKSKIIILLSDGVQEGDSFPIDTVNALAKRYNIKIYTIGIGSKGEVPVLVKIRSKDSIISQTIEQRDFGFNDAFLKDIADKNGGTYFYSKDSSSLSMAYNAINKLEKSDIKRIVENTIRDKSIILILISFLFLFAELTLRYSIFKKFP